MERPIGVTLIALVNFAVGGVCLLVATGGLSAGFVYLLASSGLGGPFGAGTFLLIGGAGLIIGLILIPLGIGLWKLRNRSRQMQIGFLVLLSAFEFFSILGAVQRSALVSAVFRSIILGAEIWILVYLLTPGVKEAFGARPRSIPASSPYDPR